MNLENNPMLSAMRTAMRSIVARLLGHRQLFFKRLVDVVRANRCILCQGRGTKQCICADCSADLPWLRHACCRCATPLSSAATTCTRCVEQAPVWQQAYAVFHFRFPIDRLISALKYHGRLVLADYFGQHLADRIDPDERPDIIVAVPIHRRRLQQRGYNQTILLARVMARQLQRPLLANELVRIRDTRMQKLLHAEQRRENLAGAFVWLGPALTDKRVLIVDDVLTTGATAEAIAACLIAAGARHIDLIVIARTLAQ